MLYIPINTASALQHAFDRAGRGNNFTYEGIEKLFTYFAELGETVELDVIAFCCEYSEGSAASIARDYNIELDKDSTNDEQRDSVREYLEEHTTIIGETHDGFVYVQF